MPISNAFSLDGKVAIVTGGAAGIGLGIVEAFDKAGARVLAVGRRENGPDVLRQVAPNAEYFAADLAEAQSADRIVDAAVRAFGTADILVNNAARLENRPVLDMNTDYIDAMLQTNIRALLLLIKAFAAHRKAAGTGGKVINIGSTEGYLASLPQGMATYSATKTAVRGITATLARELAPLRIGVNGVVPGAIVHENMLDRARAGGGEAQLEQSLEGIRQRTNAGRLGRAEDIANACIFLASDASDYISGQMLIVDGGLTVVGP